MASPEPGHQVPLCRAVVRTRERLGLLCFFRDINHNRQPGRTVLGWFTNCKTFCSCERVNALRQLGQGSSRSSCRSGGCKKLWKGDLVYIV